VASPSVSRWSSVRLPIATTFPQAPLRSRTVGFPQSGSDLGFPSWAFPESRRSSSTDIHTPRQRWFTHKLVLASSAACSRHCVRAPHWDRQVPRAPLLHGGVTAVQETSSISSWNVTPTSSLLRAHAPDPLPSLRLRHSPAHRVFAGCCQPLLGTGPSRRYLCQSFPACLDLYSGCSKGARARYFPQDIGLPRRSNGSARRKVPDSYFCRRQHNGAAVIH